MLPGRPKKPAERLKPLRLGWSVHSKRQPDLQRARGDPSGHLPAHPLHQLPHNSKSQTGPALSPGGAALVEAVKEVLRVRLRTRGQRIGEAERPTLTGDGQSPAAVAQGVGDQVPDRKSTRELQSHSDIS